jgi:hypothetical protein
MPGTACFSYSSDLPPGIDNRNAAQRALTGLPRMPHPCFSYSAGVARGNPRERTGGACFSYSAEVPPGARNRDAAQRVLRDLPRMPRPCFSYSADMSLGDRPRLPEGRICFSY